LLRALNRIARHPPVGFSDPADHGLVALIRSGDFYGDKFSDLERSSSYPEAAFHHACV
jgi:hypothetical protein